MSEKWDTVFPDDGGAPAAHAANVATMTAPEPTTAGTASSDAKRFRMTKKTADVIRRTAMKFGKKTLVADVRVALAKAGLADESSHVNDTAIKRFIHRALTTDTTDSPKSSVKVTIKGVRAASSTTSTVGEKVADRLADFLVLTQQINTLAARWGGHAELAKIVTVIGNAKS